jgi:hypothetical protein
LRAVVRLVAEGIVHDEFDVSISLQFEVLYVFSNHLGVRMHVEQANSGSISTKKCQVLGH